MGDKLWRANSSSLVEADALTKSPSVARARARSFPALTARRAATWPPRNFATSVVPSVVPTRGAAARVMGARSKHSAPRSHSGGRSHRYDARRAARGTEATLAPAWSDAAAAVVLQALHHRNGHKPSGLVKMIMAIMRCPTDLDAFVHELRDRLSPPDRALALQIIQACQAKVASSGTDAEAKAKIRAFLKPLRERRAMRSSVGPLAIAAPDGTVRGLSEWLSADVRGDRLRNIQPSRRITQGLAKWDLSWLRGPGVVVYERAHARIAAERDGVCDAAFAKALVHTTLPTATANSSDHYVLVRPDARPRFLSVNECARAFGVPADGPMFHMLTATTSLSVNQAVSCLGRAVHAGVARQIVRTLVARGMLAPGLSYGSDCSGIDLFAAAVHAEFGSEWTYAFASERDATVRKGLLAAWGSCGLTAEMVALDASRPSDAMPPCVGLYVLTPECTAHSARNHARTAAGWAASLGDIWVMLEYVRERRPPVVVVENVNETSIVAPLTGLLTRLEGYSVTGGVLTPQTHGAADIARERYYWLLTLEGTSLSDAAA